MSAVVGPLAGRDRELVEEILRDVGRVPPVRPPGLGDEGPEDVPECLPVVSSAVLGMLMFIAVEVMFFTGLVAAFLVLRLAAPVWPPPFQPRLPVEATGATTLVLLASGVTMTRAVTAIRRGDRRGLVRLLGWTALLGGLFLAVQGYEWVRLLGFGLTVASGTYGATFYTLVGAHGLHVAGALGWLLAVWYAARAGRYGPEAHTPVALCRIYWLFVVLLWPVLYGLVYLA